MSKVVAINTDANPAFVTIPDASVPFFATFAAFPDPTASAGTWAIANDTKGLYLAAFGAWSFIATLQGST